MHRHPEYPKPFADLGLEPPILRAIHAIGFKEPSPIQAELIPHILAGRDVLGQARTGTGKTAAFGLPILQMVDPEQRLQAMVLTPTRELAAQVLGEFRRFGKHLEAVHCVPVYGGTRMKEQLHQLGRRPHVVVGTPGRMMDVMNRKALSLEAVRFVVLDEVDRMLDIGFRDDIRKILGSIDHPHQTVFVSATVDEEIKKLAFRYMKDPVEINVSGDKMTVSEVAQYYCTVDPWDKYKLLRSLLQREQPKLAIIFCNTKHATRKLAQRLFADGIPARDIHGDLVQQKRERIMERFRKHKIPVLVATDLAARGIDVHEVSHIVNYDVPQDPELYVHRIGRTARMGAAGKAFMLVEPEEGNELTAIEMLINKEIAKFTVEGFTATPPPREGRGRGAPAPAASQASRGGAPQTSTSPDREKGPAAATSTAPAKPSTHVTALGGTKSPLPRRFRRR